MVRGRAHHDLDRARGARRRAATKCETVKQQIQHLVDGCGLLDLKPKRYSSKNDGVVGESGTQQNLDFLTAALRDIWAVIARVELELPTEAALPQVGGACRDPMS